MQCLDATFLIDLQAGDPEAVGRVNQWEKAGIRMAVPIPAYVEWLRGAYFKGGKTLAVALELASSLQILPAEETEGHDAARLGAELMKRGRTMSSSDLLIAAVVRHHHGVLVTRDEDFAGLPGLAVEIY